ncbi:MAG: prolipoprotein diacylglyceryl transferase [Oscillospiraceae bacterium]|nr:prolipoprotein diacylglyceryl transferase [Oscillospiraceae bacterium]
MRSVSFPGLGGLEISLNRVAFHLGSWPIYWYGVIIATGFLLAVFYCSRKSVQFGIRQDDLIDALFFAVPLSVIGARLYYIVFYLDLYRTADGGLDFVQMVRIWDGGLAIYGAVIAAILTVLVFCRWKKISFLAFADLGVFGLLIGQCIGRWGNFVNIEAYGGPTTLPWRMGIYEFVNGTYQYVEVHPTFFYESLWNLAGFFLLAWAVKQGRKFDGQIFLSYLAWYGFGRGLIEGLRSDSLYLFGTGIRVSQALGFLSSLAALVLLFWNFSHIKRHPKTLWVEQAAQKSLPPETQDEQNQAPSEGAGPMQSKGESSAEEER